MGVKRHRLAPSRKPLYSETNMVNLASNVRYYFALKLTSNSQIHRRCLAPHHPTRWTRKLVQSNPTSICPRGPRQCLPARNPKDLWRKANNENLSYCTNHMQAINYGVWNYYRGGKHHAHTKKKCNKINQSINNGKKERLHFIIIFLTNTLCALKKLHWINKKIIKCNETNKTSLIYIIAQSHIVQFWRGSNSTVKCRIFQLVFNTS